jgi:2TM family of unknown function (DUF5676)
MKNHMLWMVIGCVITLAFVPHDQAVIFFNSLLHGVNIAPILRTSMPVPEMILGLITTFILAWFAGAMTAVFYNFTVRTKS